MMLAHRSPRRIHLRYEVEPYPEDWFIEDDEKVPQSRPHHLRGNRLVDLFRGWKERHGRDVQVGKELALRWDESTPRVGVDPDVYIVEPPPPEGDDVMSLRTWETGHYPPLLAVEIVSKSRPDKDYKRAPLRYAASGTEELWIFDPELYGPKMPASLEGPPGPLEGPFRLQVWRRDEEGAFNRVHAGEGPAWSSAVGGWVFVVDEGRSLALADDKAGTAWWKTPEERERAAKEEAQRHAERLAAKLRELGVDPESIR
jgi:Uma2 family endonuclease